MKQYHKNPRAISEQALADLRAWLAELGDLSGIVHDAVYIYALRLRGTGEIFYIGKTTNLPKRANQHREKARASCKSHLYNFIRKVWANGDDWDIERVATVDRSEWQEYEIAAIERAKAIGCNLRNTTPGGAGHEMGIETRSKLSAVLSGRKLSDEHKRKLSRARQGKAPWNKGVATGQLSPMSDERARAKVSAKLKGRELIAEWRERIGRARLGKEPVNKGKRGEQGKPIEQVDLKTGKVVAVYANGVLALEAVGGKSSGRLSEAAKGICKSAYGYGWRYVELDK